MGGGTSPHYSVDSYDDRSSEDAVEVVVKKSNKKPTLGARRINSVNTSTSGTGTSTNENKVNINNDSSKKNLNSNSNDLLMNGGESTFGERGESDDGLEVLDSNNERAKLLYSKSKVYMHPTSYLRDNLPGFLSIVQVGQSHDYLLAWIPEAAIEGTPDYEAYVLVEESGVTSNSEPTLVTLSPPSTSHAFSIPIRTIYSLILQQPTLSSWYGSVTFNLYGGETLPPLYFHDEESRSTILDRDKRVQSTNNSKPSLIPNWGGESFIKELRIYTHLIKSQLESRLYLINPSKNDLEVHSTALFEDELVPLEALTGIRINGNNSNSGVILSEASGSGSGSNNGLTVGERERREAKRTSILHQSLAGSDYPEEVGPAMDNFTFSVLNSFSRITRGARSVAQNAAQSVLAHPLAKPILKNVPRPIIQFANAPAEMARLQETAGVGHYDAARVYLAKWARVVAEEGERARRAEVIFNGPGGRLEDSEVGAFEVLATTYSITRPKSTRASATPIVVTEWAAWFDDKGRLMLPEHEAKKRIFQRGLAEDVRKDVWPFLLKVYPWNSTTRERAMIRKQKSTEYEKFKAIWFENSEFRKTDVYLEESHRIEIDCRRTDRTHPMFASPELDPSEVPIDSPHPPSNAHVKRCQDILTTYVFAAQDRDYVQGMSDLLSPIYVVMEGEEVLTYYCFSTLMERMKGNFLRDQSGMKLQLSQLQSLLALMDPQLHKHLEQASALNLFFCFRWILCGFKRELSFDATLALWEVLWTDHVGTHFHLFFALAIIETHRDVIIRYLQEFDEILKYVNELSQTLDVDTLLADAETLYLTFRKVLDAADKRSSEENEKASIMAAPSAGGMRKRGGGGGGGMIMKEEIPIENHEGVVVDTTWEIDEELRLLLN